MSTIRDTEFSIDDLLFHEKGGNINKAITTLPKQESIGELLKKGRQQRGLSQKELAGLTGVKNFEISRIESGTITKPSKDVLVAIEPYTGLSFSELLLRSGYSGVDECDMYYSSSKQLIDTEKVVADIYKADYEILELLSGISNYSNSDLSLLKGLLIILDTSAVLRSHEVKNTTIDILMNSVKKTLEWLNGLLHDINLVFEKSYI